MWIAISVYGIKGGLVSSLQRINSLKVATMLASIIIRY